MCSIVLVNLVLQLTQFLGKQVFSISKSYIGAAEVLTEAQFRAFTASVYLF